MKDFPPSAWAGFQGFPPIMLDFPTRAEAQLFCPDLERLPGNSLSFNLILSAFFFVLVQKEGAGLYYFYLGCSFPVYQPQTFQILHIPITKMYLAATQGLQNSTDTFRYLRPLVSHRAGWPLLQRSRHGKTNSYFAGVLQDSVFIKTLPGCWSKPAGLLGPGLAPDITHLCRHVLFWWQVQSSKRLRFVSCHLFVLNHIMNPGLFSDVWGISSVKNTFSLLLTFKKFNKGQ